MKEKSQVTVDSSSDEDPEKKGHTQEVVVSEGQACEFELSFLPSLLPPFLPLQLGHIAYLAFLFVPFPLPVDRPEEETVKRNLKQRHLGESEDFSLSKLEGRRS